MAQNDNAKTLPSAAKVSVAADDRTTPQPPGLEFRLRMDLLRSKSKEQRLKIAEAIAVRADNY